jgi:hypothetical protein
MPDFDRAQTYQFALFFPPTSDRPARLRELPHAFAEPKTSRMWGISAFETASEQSALTFQADGVTANLAPVNATTWTAAGGVWRLIWTPLRLDIIVDVHALAAVRDEAPSLIEIAHLLAPRFEAASSVLSVAPNRLAVIVAAESSCAGSRNAARLIADLYFNDTLKSAAGRGELLDLVARVNTRTPMPMPHEDGTIDVQVNRVETAVAKWNVPTRTLSLAVQWDVNSAPEEAFSLRLVPARLMDFFVPAAEWIELKRTEVRSTK